MSFFCLLLLGLIGNLSLGQTLDKKNVSEKPFEHLPIKAIIFDCDGTLIDNGIGYFLDWQHALKNQGYELNADDFWDFMNRHRLVGAPGADKLIVAYCCELLGRECAHEILKDKEVFSEQLHRTYEFPAIEPTVNFLRAVGKEKERLGIKLGLASANSRENVLRVLKRLNINHYFDVIVTSDDLTGYNDPEGINKPKPYVYLQATKLLELSPEECIAIEDSRTGVSSAVSAGCITVAIPNTYTLLQDLSHAHLMMTSFRGMSPSDFLKAMADIQQYTQDHSKVGFWQRES